MLRRVALVIGSVLLLAGCGGASTVSPTAEKVEGTVPTQTVAKGDAGAGKAIFAAQGCGSCHTLKEANGQGKIGPNLDNALKGKSADYIRESIINPNADVVKGYGPGIMPQNYGQALSDKKIANLVALLSKNA